MTAAPCVAVVDDDADLRELLDRYLRGFDLRVRGYAEGESFLRDVAGGRVPDAVVLDLMLPGIDGLRICQALRTHSSVPVLMLTARGELADRVVGLQIGADDYLIKPFEPRELVARLQALLRRTAPAVPPQASAGEVRAARFGTLPPEGTSAQRPWRLDYEGRELTGPEGVIPIGGAEFKLLRFLLQRPGRVVSRDALLNEIHGRDAGPFDRAVDMLVSRLRARLGDSAQEPRLIKTVRGEGYLLAAAVEYER